MLWVASAVNGFRTVPPPLAESPAPPLMSVMLIEKEIDAGSR
jgi:hypothetical protein